MKEKLDVVAEEVKNVDKGINDMLIPILKDTIKDGNKYNKRMFILCIILSIILVVVIIVAMLLIYNQNLKYQEFLSQFEFESEYVQDFDTTDGGNISNSTIDVR